MTSLTSGCRYVVAELVLACTLSSAVGMLDSRAMVSQPLLLKAKTYLFGYYYNKFLYTLTSSSSAIIAAYLFFCTLASFLRMPTDFMNIMKQM